MFDTKEYEQKMTAALEHFDNELRKVRTGRAHANILDGVRVDVYGAQMPLNQVSNVTAPEAQLLQITPFDPSNIQAIAAAIRSDQGLGFNPSDDGRVIRIPIPPLTEERRQMIVKQASEKVELAKIQLRTIRQDCLKAAKAKQTAKEISEDDYKAIEKGIDDDLKNYQNQVDEAFKLKQQEIMTI